MTVRSKAILATAEAIFCLALAAGCGSSTEKTDAGNDNGTPDVQGTDVVDPEGDTVTNRDTMADDIVTTDEIVAADVVQDTDPEFHWASGCTGTPTGATWTMIDDQTFLRGPLIQMSDMDTVTVVWRPEIAMTDDGCVDYIVDGETLTACVPPDSHGQYEVTLNNLPHATEIHYSARTGALKTTDLTFRTMPDTPAPMKFAVFADAHCQVDNLQKMAQIALAEGVDFAFGVGDFVASPEVMQYDLTLSGLKNLGSRVNVWTVIGNHDTGTDTATGEYEFFNSFVSPVGDQDDAAAGFGEGYWDRRIGNVWLGGGWVKDFYFSTADSDFGEVGYFRKRFESEEFKTAQWRLFFIHEPPYCQGWGSCGEYTGESSLRVAMIPMAAANGIQATFHGHMHGYEYGQVDGVWTFLPGGLGGSLDQVCEAEAGFPQPWTYNYVHNFAIVETNCDKMIVRFMDMDGNELDRVEVPYVAPAE